MDFGGCKMWFGTVDYSGWIDAPLSGAESTPGGWSDDGGYLGGDGYSFNSWNTHKNYTYSWPASSSREMAQLMQSYRSGTFGRGKLYWIEPTIYNTNCLAAKWADPSITLDYDGPSLVPGSVQLQAATSSSSTNILPVKSVQYQLASVAASPALNDSNSVFIPIPDGMQLNLGAFYSASSGNCGVYVTGVATGGSQSGVTTRLTPITTSSANLFTQSVVKQSGWVGVRLWIGKTVSGSSTVTVAAIHARLSSIGVVPDGPQHWVGGQGHGGARFVGTPTYVTMNGVDGGQVEYAASFKETMN